MAAKASRADSATATATPEIDALNEIRLSRNWTYQQLSDAMARAGFPLPAKTLQTLIAYRPKPYDRTLYQIQRYLEKVREVAAAAEKSARRAARA